MPCAYSSEKGHMRRSKHYDPAWDADEREEAARPARPAITKTYGKPKLTPVQADTSFSSDLTSLSQLSQAPTSSAPAAKADVRPSSSQKDGNSEAEEGDKEGQEHQDSGYFPMHQSIKDMLMEVDEAFDAAAEGEAPKRFSMPELTVKGASGENGAGAPAEQKRERVVSGASSSSTNDTHRINNQPLTSTSSPRHDEAQPTSPPTSPSSHSKLNHAASIDEETELPTYSTKLGRKQRRVLDSDDEDEAAISASRRTSTPPRKTASHASKAKSNRTIEDDEEESFDLSNASDDELPSLKDIAKKKLQGAVLSDQDEEAETQKTEAIEQYDENEVYQSNGLSESPEKARKSRKPKAPSKKDEEEAHRLAEQVRRSRHASIMPRSKPARPLSEIAQRLSGAEPNRLSGSARPNLAHRPRSSSTKPALSLRASSIPLSSMQPSAKTQAKPIEIGSSSAIFDYDPNMQEDSYDLSYLKAESQSQSQDSLENETARKKNLPTKATTSPICEDEESSDEELPDATQAMKERKERERKAKALREKKAALLARQQEKAEQKKSEDVKGKGREIVMDLDSDPEELEIEITRAATPIIKAEHRSPRSHKLMRQLALKSVKKEHGDDVSDSQVHRAGRTFHGGEAKVVVAPHVAMKSTRANATKKAEHAVTTNGVFNLLMEKARMQALNDKVKRMEDWKRRGGTLRHDHATEEIQGQAEQDEEGNEDRAKDLMEAIRAGADEAADEDEDDEDDDYVASDEEAALLSGDEVGSADEEEGAKSDVDDVGQDRKLKAQGSYREKHNDVDSDEPDMSADLSSIAPTQVIASQEQDKDASNSESDDVIVVAPRLKAARHAILDNDDSQDSPVGNGAGDEQNSPSGDAQPTQYHQFVVKDAAPAFPEIGQIKDISLTQAFGRVGATQAPPQASKAAFEDGEGFSQMFGDGDAEGFTQNVEPTQTGQPSKPDVPMPSMFRRGGSSSPEVQRHAFGEAPMLLDAALRDAQIREEAERAYEKVQLERRRPVHGRQESDPTRTPGSTLSDELPPLAPVTMLVDRYEHRGTSVDESPSDSESTGSIRMEDINSPSAPRRLRRAGDVDGSQSPERPRNAFDLLKAGQLKRREDRDEKKKKDKAKKNDFIAEEVEESEDEGEYSMLRKIHEEGDDEDGSDLDATVEELVDDEKGDPDEEEAQDEMADDYHREWAVKQDAKDTKMVEKVIAGKMKRRRGEAGELDDSDYEDDDMHRVAKAKKPKQYSSKMEALTANPETQSFARANMDDGTADINGDFLQAPDPISEAASDEEDYGSDIENVPARRAMPTHMFSTFYAEESYSYSRQDMHIINGAIYGEPSSPQQEVFVEDTLTTYTSRSRVQAKSGMDCFDDIDLTYAETQTLKRRVVQLEKEESQNENGRGPGRTSAVTSFVRMASKDSLGGGSRAAKPGAQASTLRVLKVDDKKASRPTLEVSNRGRLAAARHSKR